MTEEEQKFSYDALLVRVVEQAARVLPYFDQDSEERTETAALFQELEHHIREAQEPSPEPRLERYHMEKALDKLFGLEQRIRDLGAPIEEAFNQEMQPIRDRFFEVVEQHPNLEDKLTRRMLEDSKKGEVPEEWTKRVIEKIREKSEKPSVKKSH